MADPTPPTPPAPPPPPFTPPPSGSPAPMPIQQSAPTAVWSLILGVLSPGCCGFITAIPAIILGHMGRSAVHKSGGKLGGMGMATVGLVLGYFALALHLILIPTIAIPALIKARHEARARVEHISTKGHEIISSKGNARITVPNDWIELSDLNPAAEIQSGNKSKEQYVMVIVDSKADFEGMTLSRHHQLTRDAMLKKMTNASATAAVEITVDEQPAMQDEISGTQQGVNIVFLHTTVEEDDGFHQILAWTSKSQWDAQKENLREVTQSFRGDH